MVLYFGRHNAKMFIWRKPICFGYKIWMLYKNDGYPYYISIYQGKNQRTSMESLGTGVVMKMAHQLCFDNFFTNYDMLVKLAGFDIRETRAD
ncbi:PiggyBac transposable element-derived protein 3 [Trichinella pseudospiralis]|uniref:PiggyBac transposable element-derived protein 3 n=1 Tax=Trichinella pseudospiralis TaxID=6337 RepID=A0A0V1J5Q2_TRIPS|nr:PiggyBac transposable element-derived protein 3 [Trichinella pseudospiralis]